MLALLESVELQSTEKTQTWSILSCHLGNIKTPILCEVPPPIDQAN